MIALVFAVIAYCRAFFIGRSPPRYGDCELRHQLIVFKRKQPRPLLCSCDRAFLGGAPPFVAGLGKRPDHR